jgi:hypothetical protein
MPRAIIVENCSKCPHRDHKGAFGKVAYIPVCRLKNRELPYVSEVTIRGTVVANQIGNCPDWCPLPIV